MRVQLITRRGCHLCQVAERELARLSRCWNFNSELVDVDSDPELQLDHGFDVPVLLVDGQVISRHRLDGPRLARALRQAAGALDPPPEGWSR